MDCADPRGKNNPRVIKMKGLYRMMVSWIEKSLLFTVKIYFRGGTGEFNSLYIMYSVYSQLVGPKKATRSNLRAPEF